MVAGATSDSPVGHLVRHLPRRAIPLAVLGIVLLVVVSWWAVQAIANRGLEGYILASGTVEAEEVNVSAEAAGRITRLGSDEGETVKAGDVLVEIDPTLANAQVAQAQAAVDVARASLALVQAGARPEDVRQAEAALVQANAARDAARQGWQNAIGLRDNPQELTARIDAAETGVAAAEARLAQVQKSIKSADLDAARSALQASRTGLAQAEAAARNQETQASEALASAEANLRIMTQGPREEDLRAAEISVEQAKDALYSAQSSRDGVCGNGRNPRYLCDAANAQVSAGESAVDGAANQLTKLKNGPTTEEIRTAQAAVEQARSSLEAARSTSTPTVAAAKSAVAAAESRLSQLEQGATPEDLALASANLDQAKRGLADLLAIRDNPLAANAQVDSARGQHDVAIAVADAAVAKLEAVKNGATKEQVDVARAQVAQSEAALAAANAQRDRLTVKAPVGGIVSSRNLRVGETAAAGSPVYSIASLDEVKLTIYVPEPRIGQVALGQQVEISVDPFPGEWFQGTVVYISPSAEFTPRNVQTQRDRAMTVFSVKVKVPNPDHRLKPGLTADARIKAARQ